LLDSSCNVIQSVLCFFAHSKMVMVISLTRLFTCYSNNDHSYLRLIMEYGISSGILSMIVRLGLVAEESASHYGGVLLWVSWYLTFAAIKECPWQCSSMHF